MTNADVFASTAAHEFGLYARQPLALVRGAGCWVWDADGRRYLDFFAGIVTTGATVSFGVAPITAGGTRPSVGPGAGVPGPGSAGASTMYPIDFVELLPTASVEDPV